MWVELQPPAASQLTEPRTLGGAQFEERPQRGRRDGQLRLAHLAEPLPGRADVAADAVRLDHRGVAEGVGLELPYRHGLGDLRGKI